MKSKLNDLLELSREKVKLELGSAPEVCNFEGALGPSDLSIVKRKWISIEDAIVVVADLKNSTKLGVKKWASSTARIYEASTGNVTRIFDSFEADFIAIQGDGAFAIFWGKNRVARALCSAITVKTFGRDLVDQLDSKWDSLPETGLKVGIASGRLLAKKIGVPRRQEWQEPVWPGRAVNYAFKAAAAADRDELIVTKSVWDKINSNDFLRYSCGCGDATSDLWESKEIDKLPSGDREASGMVLASSWCPNHGEDFCEAVLNGETERKGLNTDRMKIALSKKKEKDRAAIRNRGRKF
ncbi:hypothetical protein [Corynebacterium tuberculostearicum]|uniref:hypothetical protein n=1 Tax=Corynebacterium tuberculostearicum TaxID=38304 RepID=UPI0038D22A2D